MIPLLTNNISQLSSAFSAISAVN